MVHNTIDGNPTKKFFIEMITRDISIEDAIIDLLDNSIDGANNINPNDYSGLEIELIDNSNEFSIRDNCGGFTLETAQKYAFRFGRPDEAPISHNTVGRFGIGMKRSLFKMGKHFEVETQNQDNHFIVDVDVEEWSRKQQIVLDENRTPRKIDDWSFLPFGESALTCLTRWDLSIPHWYSLMTAWPRCISRMSSSRTKASDWTVGRKGCVSAS